MLRKQTLLLGNIIVGSGHLDTTRARTRVAVVLYCTRSGNPVANLLHRRHMLEIATGGRRHAGRSSIRATT